MWTCALLAGYLAPQTGISLSAERVRVLRHQHGRRLTQPPPVVHSPAPLADPQGCGGRGSARPTHRALRCATWTRPHWPCIPRARAFGRQAACPGPSRRPAATTSSRSALRCTVTPARRTSCAARPSAGRTFRAERLLVVAGGEQQIAQEAEERSRQERLAAMAARTAILVDAGRRAVTDGHPVRPALGQAHDRAESDSSLADASISASASSVSVAWRRRLRSSSMR